MYTCMTIQYAHVDEKRVVLWSNLRGNLRVIEVSLYCQEESVFWPTLTVIRKGLFGIVYQK